MILFLCTLTLVNPIVHGDGVGYYAYVRAPLIQHNVDFAEDCVKGRPPLFEWAIGWPAKASL